MLKPVYLFIFVFASSFFIGHINASSQVVNEKNIFVVYNPITDIQEFEAYAKQMARLKPFGRVDVWINNASEKAGFELPEGGGEWHEYASYNRNIAVFYPDEKIAPYIPEELVKKNQGLLNKKLKIIRKLGLGAAFRSNEPHYLPEVFFDKYPHLRGPRVDHPRRSNQKEFAPCFHQEGTVEMYQNMVNKLFSQVPEINTLYFSMNDAGSGFCWADWLYSGPNGPSACENISLSESIVTMLNVYKEGAKQTGHGIDIFFNGMFTEGERDDIAAKLPGNCYLRGRNYPSIKGVSGMGGEVYPVRGIINPLRILRSLNRGVETGTQRYNLSFRTAYDRGHERLETIEKLIDIVEWQLQEPAGKGEINTLTALKDLCVKWAGEESADRLFDAFVALDKAFLYKHSTAGALSTLYWGVSTRHITRPLVFVPQLLTTEEEAYFLPYIFNVSIKEARDDYMDIHGGNRTLPDGVISRFSGMLKRVYSSLEKIENAPEQDFLQNMAKSLRIYSSVIRSCSNFYEAQEIRNRNKEVLAGPIHRPGKTPTWTGDQDLLDFNAIMRDELDNTLELIDVLEDGGMELVSHAQVPFEEDTFVLGANLIEQLKKKRKIMLKHWTDIEGYMATPFK